MHQIGSGVLGPVYRARRSDCDPPDNDGLVALKVFHVDLTPEQTIVFCGALQGIVDLEVAHPALASPLGAGVADGVPYLAYEYVAGDSLDVRMRPRAPLAADVALPYVARIAEAMDAAHARGLVHGAFHLRDVRITSDGACVGGFGIVAALDRVGRRGPLRPPYAAPEQVAGGEWGAAADRYALAAVAWELLTGRRAAPADGRMAGRLEPAPGAEAASRLAPLFEAALAADPDRRPRSARRFAGDLAVALDWTGATAASRAAGRAGEDGTKESGAGRGPERGEGEPAVAVGGVAPPGGEPAAAAAGGAVMGRRTKRTPWRRKQAEVDWTKRALDFGPPGELSGADPGGPDAGDAAAAEGASDASGAGGDRIDEALGDRNAAPGDGREAGADLELRTGADPLTDVAEGLHAGFQDGRGGAVDGADTDDAGLAPEPPAADGYSPISVGELESRVERGAVRTQPSREPLEAGSEPRYGAEGVGDESGGEGSAPEGPHPVSSGSSGEDDVDRDEGEFALPPEGRYRYGLEDESEDPAGEIFDRGPVDEARRLPVVLVAVLAVAVAVTAFVMGLGWMGGADDDGASVAAGDAAAPEDPGRTFSEAVVDVGDAAPEPPAAANDSPAVAAASPDGGPPAVAAAVAAPESGDAPAAARRPEAAAEPSPVAPAPPAPVPAVGDGRLLVRSMPPGAEVVVNGQSRGTTPLALAELPYGPYDVEVTLAGYGSRRERLVLDSGDPIGALNVDLTADSAGPSAAGGPPAGSAPAAEVAVGSILAETRPPGAAVWLDRRLVGETPMSIPRVPAGAHRIEFRLDGYRTWTTTVEVASATQARVAASLADAVR